MQTLSKSPANTSKLPVILEVLFLLGLVAAMCLLPSDDNPPSETVTRHIAK